MDALKMEKYIGISSSANPDQYWNGRLVHLFGSVLLSLDCLAETTNKLVLTYTYRGPTVQ